MKILVKNLLLGALGASLLAGCKKQEVETYYTPVADPGFFNVGILTTNLSTTFNAKYAPGETLPITAAYNQADGPSTITVFQATKTDSAQVGSYPAAGTYNSVIQQLAQPVPYVVPTTYAIGTSVRVDVTLNFPDGSQRLRRFTYQVALAPTLVAGTPAATYRNGLSATAQSEGDLIGYAVTLNAGGISTSTTPVANLFKNVDSLVYYARVGTTGALQRQGVIRTPTAGAESKRTIDLRIPTGSSGVGATFVFTAFAQSTSATFTTPLQAVGATTPFRTLRQGRVSLGGGLPADSVAFNLSTGLNEPAANAITAKDIQLATTSSTGALTLFTPNATRYYKLTAAQLSATPYATATANAIGLLIYQNTTSADLGTPAVGDVYAVRLRGTAEVMLLRILSVRTAASGGLERVRFDYRSL